MDLLNEMFRKFTLHLILQLSMIKEIKQVLGDNKLVAVAGGITPDKVDKALSSGADIIVVGRNIFLESLPTIIPQLIITIWCSF